MQPTGSFRAEDPAQGTPIGALYPISGAMDIEASLVAASDVAKALAATPAGRIADFLDAYADAIERDGGQLSLLAQAETSLPLEPRLRTIELPRTCHQLRQAAHAARHHAWTQPVIDTTHDLRTHLAPLGKPVLVFGPNNFPLAFNAVSGSDFASAIAARNPVIAKAHPSHPATSERLAQLAHAALLATGLPAAAVQMIYHLDNAPGLAMAGDPRLGAIGFTGSRAAGLALKHAADGAGVCACLEMSSVNPVFVLPGALAERGHSLAHELLASCTLGGGQFCTNPGVVMVPRGAAGDAFVTQCIALFSGAAPAILFSRGVRTHLENSLSAMQEAGAELLAGGCALEPGFRFAPTLLGASAASFLHQPALQAEAFGPATLVVRADDNEMAAIAAAIDGNLTGTIYAADSGSDEQAWNRLLPLLRPRVGRLICNRMPTGVAVSPAMNHGGPYPSTGHPGFTAVGMPAAIRRFSALHCYDHVPEHLLPPELRDANPGGVSRCIDGFWVIDDISHREHH